MTFAKNQILAKKQEEEDARLREIEEKRRDEERRAIQNRIKKERADAIRLAKKQVKLANCARLSFCLLFHSIFPASRTSSDYPHC